MALPIPSTGYILSLSESSEYDLYRRFACVIKSLLRNIIKGRIDDYLKFTNRCLTEKEEKKEVLEFCS